jgi:hypothetical protein
LSAKFSGEFLPLLVIVQGSCYFPSDPALKKAMSEPHIRERNPGSPNTNNWKKGGLQRFDSACIPWCYDSHNNTVLPCPSVRMSLLK